MKSPFAKAVKSWDLDETPVKAGASRWLDVGGHPTVIEDLDTQLLDKEGKLVLTFRGLETKGFHKEYIFLTTKDGEQLSRDFRALLGALLPDLEALEVYQEMLADAELYEHALQSLRGLRVWVDLDYTEGYRVVADGDQYFAVVAQDESQVIATGRKYEDVERTARSNGHRKAIKRVFGYESIDADCDEYNLSAFEAITKTIFGTKDTESPTAQSDTRGFAGTGTTKPRSTGGNRSGNQGY